MAWHLKLWVLSGSGHDRVKMMLSYYLNWAEVWVQGLNFSSCEEGQVLRAGFGFWHYDNHYMSWTRPSNIFSADPEWYYGIFRRLEQKIITPNALDLANECRFANARFDLSKSIPTRAACEIPYVCVFQTKSLWNATRAKKRPPTLCNTRDNWPWG